MEREGADDFLIEVADEEPDAAQFADQVEIPDDVELSDWAKPYWIAWHRLSSDRPLGAMGGAGRIPWSVIAGYAERRFPDDIEMTERYARMLWAMDDVYLGWLTEKQKAEANKTNAS